MSERAKIVLILAVTVLFGAGVSYYVLKTESENQAEIEAPTRQLARALEAGKPSAAPAGARGYVRGVREYYGRIREARFLDAYTARYGSGRNATTDTVSEMFVHGRRGAGVLELDFEEDEIDGMRELDPDDVHSDLSAADQIAVERGFERRGGKTANIIILKGAVTRDELAR